MIQYIYLNPDRAGAFLLHGRNGANFTWQLSDDISQAFESIAQAIKSDTQLASTSSAAQAIRQANAEANRDFLVRQCLKAVQYNNQSAMTALMNMQTMNGAALINASIFLIFSRILGEAGL